MAIKCSDTAILKEFVEKKHNVAPTHPSGTQTKYDFPCGLVMNVYTNGTVFFQGDSHESRTAADIMNVIDAINR